jgi:hypothetical protein
LKPVKSFKAVRPAGGWCAAAALCLACVLGTALLAAAGGPRKVGAAATPRTGADARTVIVGAAWAADNSPLGHARLQLRDIVSGRVEATTVADEKGQFTVHGVQGGTYVVELIGANDKILVVGHPFAIAPGETVSTFVRLGTKVPWFSGFFSNAAAAAATSAASQGITALAPVQIPTSRKQ